jgi:REP element-mobilizing transposase RayT
MRYSDPLGYMLTVTTYGNWLHGNERGSHERKGPIRFHPPNFRLLRWEESKLKHPPMVLNAAQRAVVQKAIERECEHRGYTLRALNVRTNHFHAVILTSTPPAKVLNGIKAWATRALREARVVGAKQSVWTKGGSRHWLWTEEDVRDACLYVNEGQGVDLPEG